MLVIRRAPVAPRGWPRAMAPPLGLVRAGSKPVSLSQAMTTEAKASLISTQSMSDRLMPVFFSAARVAGIGAVRCQIGSSPSTPRWWMRARGVRP